MLAACSSLLRGRFVSCTLDAAQAQEEGEGERSDLARACKAAIDFLVENRFVVVEKPCADAEQKRESEEETERMSPTQLGKVGAVSCHGWRRVFGVCALTG